MLNDHWVMAALYSQTDIHFQIESYQRRIQMITSFHYNTEVHDPWTLYEKIVLFSTRIKNLRKLQKAVRAGFHLLNGIQQRVVALIFFREKSAEEAAAGLGKSVTSVRYYKRTAIRKLSAYLSCFGFTDQTFIDTFDEDPLIVRNYETVLTTKRRADRFTAVPRETDRRNQEADAGGYS